jgi:hypothetical protein
MQRAPYRRTTRGVPHVTDSTQHRPRVFLGMAVTPAVIALLLAVLAVGALVGLSVLSWLEHSA